jgi:hypothetical protein
MRRLAVAIFLATLTTHIGVVRAEQLSSPQTLQFPPLTSDQVVLNCAMTGIAVAALAAIGLGGKPVTGALHMIPAPVNQAIYGCGLGVVGAVGMQSLLGMLPPIPLPPPPDQSAQRPPSFSITATGAEH